MVSIAHNDGPRRTEDFSRKGTEKSLSKAKPKVTFWIKQIIETYKKIIIAYVKKARSAERCWKRQRNSERTNERVKVIEQTLTASMSSRVTLSLDLIASEAGSNVTEASVSDCLSVEEKKSMLMLNDASWWLGKT